MDEREMRERLDRARLAHLATVSPTGHPHVVPICFTLVGDDISSVVDHKPKSTIDLARLENVRHHPSVSLVVDFYDDADWDRLWWVRADGEARVIESGVEYSNAIHRLRAKYPQYSLRRPTGPVLAIRVQRLSGWTASRATMRAGLTSRQAVRSE